MFIVELKGLILINEYFLHELLLEVAIKEIRENSGLGDVSCPFSSFTFN